ncbi:hypothetical protein P3875_11510 [Myroides sp. JBRI-B21084]|uniref:hypothetical protein n=1 Tax=Myroides sp. JBRI-B21084 TaxID=3119977 RepID=UPI0026E302A4|nr:hypothetical protein [Paenimyroides cloacae]WKW46385.1 hypothetical protein P3875_11510 [Paenimyroides cloacae]
MEVNVQEISKKYNISEEDSILKINTMLNSSSFESNKQKLKCINDLLLKIRLLDELNNRHTHSKYFVDKVFINIRSLITLLDNTNDRIYDFNTIVSIIRNILESIVYFDNIFTESSSEEEADFNYIIFEYQYFKDQKMKFKKESEFYLEYKEKEDEYMMKMRMHVLQNIPLQAIDKKNLCLVKNGSIISKTMTDYIIDFVRKGNRFRLSEGFFINLYKHLSGEAHNSKNVIDYFRYSIPEEREIQIANQLEILLNILDCFTLSIFKYYKINLSSEKNQDVYLYVNFLKDVNNLKLKNNKVF